MYCIRSRLGTTLPKVGQLSEWVAGSLRLAEIGRGGVPRVAFPNFTPGTLG